jgi:hypothetical protein
VNHVSHRYFESSLALSRFSPNIAIRYGAKLYSNPEMDVTIFPSSQPSHCYCVFFFGTLLLVNRSLSGARSFVNASLVLTLSQASAKQG